MSRGINKVIIVGNLGQDPEMRFFPNGGSVCNTTVATSESWKDKQTGEQKEQTEWHKVQFNNRLAEIAAEYLKKGSKVYLEGMLHTRKWQNNQGQDQYTTEIRVREMQMLDSRQGNDNAPHQQGNNQQQAPQGAYQAHNQRARQAQQQAHRINPQEPNMDFDSDIPF